MIPRCQRGGPGSIPGWRTAVVVQLGERQTEDLKVPDSISGDGRLFFCNFVLQNYKQKVLPGFEPGSLDSKSRVITITLQKRLDTQKVVIVGLEPTTLGLLDPCSTI